MGIRDFAAACGLAVALGMAPWALADDVVATPTAGAVELSLSGAVFHAADGAVTNLRTISVPGSVALIARWTELDASGAVSHWVAVSRDGERIDRVAPAGDIVRLRYAEFDPGQFTPGVAPELRAQAGHDAWIVQYESQPLEALDSAVEAAGGRITRFLPENSRIVRAPAQAIAAIGALPFVRWVGPYQPAYKLDDPILEEVAFGAAGDGPSERRYSIQLLERGPGAMAPVEAALAQMGAPVNLRVPEVARLEATLTLNQVRQMAHLPDVLFIDLWSPPENDMNLARAIGGANHLETLGFTGVGVTGEVLDSGILQTHQEFVPRPIMHGSSGIDSHGTSTYSIVFAEGRQSSARGMLPDGRGVFASYNSLSSRYSHTRDLVLPTGPYRAVFQTNSWGHALTTNYTTFSSEMDRIIFDMDLLITQSQSNAGSTQSRPQAWAKNIVSVGGVVHRDTLTKSDDSWGGASFGPAVDTRVKPELTHFYDSTFAAHSQTAGSYTQFGGTSGATPIVAGHFGLLFEMWSKGVFGNEVSGGDVFDERPRFTTAKALMINTASQYPLSQGGLTRARQGWGMPDLRAAWDLREKMFIVNEDEVLRELESASYQLLVNPGEPALRATMVFSDPEGTTSSTVHRINDLSLKVTSPSGATYWGNNGLVSSHWSTPGGSANVRDPLENVFVQNPEPGLWTVEVIASDINEDGHRETATVDADFALVVSGVEPDQTALELPFEEAWPSTTIDTQKWPQVGPGAGVYNLAPNPPSAPNVLLLNNGGQIASARLDAPVELMSTTPVQVDFWTQHRGVEPGKALVVEYFRPATQDWRLLKAVVSDGTSQDHFVRHSQPLPADGYGEGLRFRITAAGSDPTDFWHVDDIFVITDAGCYADCDGSGGLDFFDFLCFQSHFAAGDPEADCDGNGELDFFDFLCFQSEFAAGCP